MISTGYSINADCPIINIRQNGQKLDFIGTLKAPDIDRIRTMIVKENQETGMITIYTGGDECLTVFRQIEETETDSIYALRLKSVRLTGTRRICVVLLLQNRKNRVTTLWICY